MQLIKPKPEQDYITIFLTYRCNYTCEYCINLADTSRRLLCETNELTTANWIDAINRFDIDSSLPITLQGGEPTLYKGLYDIISNINANISIELITNLSFDVNEFMRNISPNRFNKHYARMPLRASYHPSQVKLENMALKALRLQDAGYPIEIELVAHPAATSSIVAAQTYCNKIGIPLVIREYMGRLDNIIYGNYMYDGAIYQNNGRYCMCKNKEFLISPNGHVYRCYADMYANKTPIGHILDDNFTETTVDVYRHCDHYGQCNPCNIKANYYRPRTYGQASVDIQFGEQSN